MAYSGFSAFGRIKGWLGKGDDSGDKAMGEMNTTPLIDVMLVLLIMFIITVPIQTHSVKVDLPQPPKNPTILPDAVKNKLTISADNVMAWNGTLVDQRQLAHLLDETKKFDVAPELQFQPDPLASYVVVDETLATIKHAQVSKLGFIGNEQYARVF